MIGATPVCLFDTSSERPSLLAPGDAVRFEPISFDEHEAIRAAVAAGRYACASEEIEA